MITQVIRATLTLCRPGDPDGVFAARVRGAVEPAEAGLDLEPALLEQHPPLERGEPRERHRRRLVSLASHGERERTGRRVPVRSLEDAGLALEIGRASCRE